MKKTAKLLLLCLCACSLLPGLSACVEKKEANLDGSLPAAASTSSASGPAASGTPDSSAPDSSAPASGDTFEWVGYTVRIIQYTDDPEEVSGPHNDTPSGRYVGVQLEPVGEEGFLYETVSGAYAIVPVQDGAGNSYTPTSMSMTLGGDINIRELEGSLLPDITLVYDIPTDVPLDALSLHIPDGEVIALAGYL